MPLRKSPDWHREAVAYVRWSLASSRSVAAQIARRVNIEAGTFVAYVPADRAVTEFRYGGSSTVLESLEAIVEVCGEFLSLPGRVALFEHHLIDLADAREYLNGDRRVTVDSVVQIAFPGATSSELMAIVREWNVVPIFNAFLVEMGEEAVSVLRHSGADSKIDLDPIVAGIRQIVCGAYDGCGLVLWRDAQDPGG